MLMNSDDGNKKEYSRLKAVVHPKNQKFCQHLLLFTAVVTIQFHCMLQRSILLNIIFCV